VDSPVFVLSSVRSGSTLLRVLLNSHSRIRAPHEMHLRTLHVRFTRDFTTDAMRELRLDEEELEHVLWDRVLRLELTRSGKDVIVDKTPANTLVWPRLHRCWPNARYILLLRHPGAIVDSLTRRRTDPDHRAIRAEVLGYAEKLEEARTRLDAHVVTYGGADRRTGTHHPRPLRPPRRPVGARDARLRQPRPRHVPPQAGRLEHDRQVGPSAGGETLR
jgi:hypothetical protein